MPTFTPAPTTTATEFLVDDVVVYRDPVEYWAGNPGNTTVCRVSHVARYSRGTVRYTLQPVTGGLIRDVQGDYMRLLPPADTMHDIDTAPLDDDTAAERMPTAAFAWLRQELARDNSTLPACR
ncbi:hypothetical protein ACFWC2_23680 [Streptomyces diastaticus]|uniref:hypothetical protein n=1 Tax=Streptomyces diastaticus TaxID=1956 RepID=UPI0036646B69